MANQQEHEAPPERMKDRCPLCTRRIGNEQVTRAHVITDHKRTPEETTDLMERYCA